MPQARTAGLIQRVESPHDARRKLLSLTDEGKSVLSQVNRRARRLDKALLDGDDDIDMAALLNALGARWERIAEVDKLR